MSRRGRRGRDGLESVRIDVTSLVDVAFTLLVIFIITAPIMQGGVEVDVPRADVGAIRAADDPFYVTVHRDGSISVADTPIDADKFADAFPQLLRAARPDVVYVRGDSLAYWGPVLRVIASVAQTEGITFALVAEPMPGRR